VSHGANSGGTYWSSGPEAPRSIRAHSVVEARERRARQASLERISEVGLLQLRRVHVAEAVHAADVRAVLVVEEANDAAARVDDLSDLALVVALADGLSTVRIDERVEEAIVVVEELPRRVLALGVDGLLVLGEILHLRPPEAVFTRGPDTAARSVVLERVAVAVRIRLLREPMEPVELVAPLATECVARLGQVALARVRISRAQDRLWRRRRAERHERHLVEVRDAVVAVVAQLVPSLLAGLPLPLGEGGQSPLLVVAELELTLLRDQLLQRERPVVLAPRELHHRLVAVRELVSPAAEAAQDVAIALADVTALLEAREGEFLTIPVGVDRRVQPHPQAALVVVTIGCRPHPDVRARRFFSGLGVRSMTLAST
jgi:hypothetical protein